MLTINAVVVAVYVAASMVQYAEPLQWPATLSILGLLFPYLLLMVLLLLVFWLVIKPKVALLSAIAIVLTGGSILQFFAIKTNTDFVQKKEPNSIRIVTWNVARFVEMIRNNNKGSQTRYKMLQQIHRENADVLCFQEFSSSINPDWYNNIIAIGKGLGYANYYFSHDWDGDGLFNGNVIFSRLPIIDSGAVRYPRPTLPDAVVFVDVKKGKDTFRVYTTHLQSNQFKKEDIEKIEALKKARGNIIGNLFLIFSKLKTAFEHRSIQAGVVADLVANSPHANIVCGDLNDVPNSYSYHTVRGNMQDAFLKKGFGIGRTYNSLAPTLRIDYVFADKLFEVKQFKRIVNNYSDHYMLVADLQLKSNTK